MGWKDWSYKLKGCIVSVILYSLLYLISFIFQQNFYVGYFRSAFLYELVSFAVLGFFIGWAIDSFKEGNSATNKGLKIGLIFFACVVIFMGFIPPLSNFYFNFIANNGWLALVLAILIPALIGFVADKMRGTRDKSREIWLSMLSTGIIALLVLGLYGLGLFFYGNDSSKCSFYSDKDACYSEVALNLVNQGKLQISLCEKIQYDSLKYKCYIWLAGQNKDLQICEKILSLPTKNKCIINLAVLQNDVSVCDKVQKEFKEECLSSVSKGFSSY